MQESTYKIIEFNRKSKKDVMMQPKMSLELLV